MDRLRADKKDAIKQLQSYPSDYNRENLQRVNREIMDRVGKVVYAPIAREFEARKKEEERKIAEEKRDKIYAKYKEAKNIFDREIVPVITKIDETHNLIRQLYPDSYLSRIPKNETIKNNTTRLGPSLYKLNVLIKQLEELDGRGFLSYSRRIGHDRKVWLLNRGDNYTGPYVPDDYELEDRELTKLKQKVDAEVRIANNNNVEYPNYKYFAKWVPSEEVGGWLGNEGVTIPAKWIVGNIQKNLIPIPIPVELTGTNPEDTTSRAAAPAPSAPPADDVLPPPSAPPLEEEDPVNNPKYEGGLRPSKTKTHRRRRSTYARTSKRLRRRTARASASSRGRRARKL